jgi:hypothetical protein
MTRKIRPTRSGTTKNIKKVNKTDIDEEPRKLNMVMVLIFLLIVVVTFTPPKQQDSINGQCKNYDIFDYMKNYTGIYPSKKVTYYIDDENLNDLAFLLF